jgi:hypothetical protein
MHLYLDDVSTLCDLQRGVCGHGALSNGAGQAVFNKLQALGCASTAVVTLNQTCERSVVVWMRCFGLDTH